MPRRGIFETRSPRRRNGWLFRRADLRYLTHKTVSELRNGLNVLLVPPVIADGPPDRGDHHWKIGFVDVSVGPDRREQFRFGHYFAALLYQQQERVESSRLNLHAFAVAYQFSSGKVNPNRAEFIGNLVSHRHFGTPNATG